MISSVIVTYNDEEKLNDCLKSIRDECDEIVIVDLGSTDKTLKIAQKYNVKIFAHSFADYVEKVRNYAVSKTSGQWILVLDADERVSLRLWEQLKKIETGNKDIAVNIPRKNIFFGKWIKHTNWWPDKQIRFFKKGTVSWTDKIHSYPKVTGKVYELAAKENLAIVHYGYNNLDQFIARQNRYSNIQAQHLYQEGSRFSWFNFFWKPFREFLVRFISYEGFLDGFYGFALTYLMMVYQIQVQIELWELERKK